MTTTSSEAFLVQVRPADATFVIAPNVSTWDGSAPTGGPARPVQAGDVVEIAGGATGTRGPLEIRNVHGADGSPVVIRGEVGRQVVIRRTTADAASGGFVFQLNNARHVRLDGENPSVAERFGLKIMYSTAAGDGPSAFVKVGDSAQGLADGTPFGFVTLRYLDVDGGWPASSVNGIGISVNDHSHFNLYTDPGNALADGTPLKWHEGVLIERCRVRSCEGEGMYVGPNWRHNTPTGRDAACEDDLPLRDIEIRHNHIESTGWDSCNCKSWVAGDNRIHHNVMKSNALRSDPTQQGGITANNCHVSIYNNWLEDSGDPAIQTYMYQLPDTLPSPPFGPFEARIYNNVVVGCRTIGGNDSKGISSGGDDASHRIRPLIYNNTVVDATGAGINVNANARSGGQVVNNLVADSGAIGGTSYVTASHNRQGTKDSMGFVDHAARDFALTAASPAVDAGTASLFPDDDYAGVSRPQGGGPDQGAFERAG
jgi:hypothetical protein